MSQAPVGQRSAHRPQCRQTSSSLTMTRPVFSGPPTYRSCARLSAGAFRRWRSSASSPSAVKVMQSIGQMSTQASHSMQALSVNTVCTSQFRQRCASLNAVAASKPSSTSTLMLASAFGRLGPGHLVARVERGVVVVAPLVDAHLLRHQVDHGRRARRACPRPLQEAVDRHRRLVPVGHGRDDVLRPEGRVAAEEHLGQRGLEAVLEQLRQAPPVERDAAVALDPGEGVLLADGHQHLVAVEEGVGLAGGHQAAPALGVVHGLDELEGHARAAGRPRARRPWARGS